MIHTWSKKIRFFTLVSAAFFLFSCSNVPNTIQIQPKISTEKNIPAINSNITWSLSSQDRRIAHYLIEISAGDGLATLVNESNSSRLIIQQTLNEQWVAQGLNLSPNNDYKIDVQLIKLLAKVKQSTYKHKINSEVVIKIQLKSNNKTFSKTFNSHTVSEAPLNADGVKISAQLNKQLSLLLTEIVIDPELNTKLQKF
ncbi:Uncharacterized lipoprotein [Psychromonas ingrahamii 37]|uniref:Uncharacterized lipoprotein n=1 Tax=Psychromonas ingrahamii (strain DSM 17664 / CCUG 51855 / 37) TaxID=357804 RepID=A1STV5_PSYIN|nr:YajG family lipoprotein [Psychromonas ingrahamii]ABM02920.1 Uncharacterized lipoprotein [Psychromonas ingrahamii 37]